MIFPLKKSFVALLDCAVDHKVLLQLEEVLPDRELRARRLILGTDFWPKRSMGSSRPASTTS